MGGKSVYLSNDQIGGAMEVMMPNGVSHCEVSDDLEGAYQILKWLSYIPSARGVPYPIEQNLLSLHDPIDRQVTFYPTTDKYDPRCLIAGDMKNILVPNKDTKTITEEAEDTKEEGMNDDKNESCSSYNEWLSGLFDRDSFTEYLSSWACSVCIGRGRLGGIPVGIIATETRTTQCVQPPDPALEDESRSN